MSEFNINVSGGVRDLLKNGNEFLKAAERCAAQDESGTIHIFDDGGLNILPAATVVNASFACEMYLKALLCHYKIDYPTDKNGHNLERLYSLLPDNTKNRIDKMLGKTSHGDSLMQSFVKRHQRDFVDARYYVTKEGWQGLDPIKVLFTTFNFGQVTMCLLNSDS